MIYIKRFAIGILVMIFSIILGVLFIKAITWLFENYSMYIIFFVGICVFIGSCYEVGKVFLKVVIGDKK